MPSKNTTLYIFLFFVVVATPFVIELGGPDPDAFAQDRLAKAPQDDRAKVVFWQYWSGSEKKPLEDLVTKFNSENHGFEVEMLSISMPRKKILMAIAAGVPPDLIHLDGDMVVDLGLRGGLLDLSPEFEAQGSKFEDFIPIYREMLNINGKQFAMPLMPTCEAMHVNKTLLDQYRLPVPQSLDDIVKVFDALTLQSSKALQPHIAWLPSWPPWSGKFIVSAFGGDWQVANSPENVKAWTWVQKNFASKIPSDKLAAFTEGFHAYQSPDNPFYSGRIAIENSGVWEYNLAGIFAPKMKVAVAPFPGEGTQVAVDALAIPRDAKHPKEALEFMQWLAKQGNLEYLALAQKKFSPLKNVSDDFFARHENPYIKVFVDLANSPSATYFPQVAYASRYKREIKEAYSKILRMEASPQEALDELQAKFSAANN